MAAKELPQLYRWAVYALMDAAALGHEIEAAAKKLLADIKPADEQLMIETRGVGNDKQKRYPGSSDARTTSIRWPI